MDLDVDYLMGLYATQKGFCFYSGVEMYCGPRIWPHTMSVDRLDPKLGYVKGNVVLCTYESNTSKGMRTEAEFYTFCARVLEKHQSRLNK